MSWTETNAKRAVKFLASHHPYQGWVMNDDVFCSKCDSVFKVLDMVVSAEEIAACPVCLFDMPDQFHFVPDWRRDLVDKFVFGKLVIHKWRVKPIVAAIGRPERLPPKREDSK